MNRDSPPRDLGIWWFAFGYFACYAPYSALSKALSDGRLGGMTGGISGFALLPATALASLVGMFLFLTLMEWWKYAGRRTVWGVTVPCPGRWTFLSGLCTAAIIPTTTLAYCFGGVSIVFMMLLMRGGVLVIAPIVDALTGRKVRWYSATALVLSLAALVVAFVSKASFGLTVIAAVDVAIYLASYFIRLRFMSRLAKSDDLRARTRYFVEEQMTATPVLVLTLALFALIGQGRIMQDLRDGFVAFPQTGQAATAWLVGLLSQGTGIFGGLILLDKRENTFCVPVNRASSVLAGIVASYSLMWLLGTKPPPWGEMVGAALIIAAIVVLAVPAVRGARRPGS
jgi:hypothetical protein